MATWFELGTDAPAASWRRIRSLRADPPLGLQDLLTGERKRVFQVALEQSQQQFTAASAIGYESRPLNLFYGLSQAGRAIAAASHRLGDIEGAVDPHWICSGHGLRYAGDLSSVDFLDSLVTVTPTQRDSFSRISIALDSPTDLNRVSLGEVMSQILELRINYGRALVSAPVLTPNGIYGTPSPNIDYERFELLVPTFTPDWPVEQVHEFLNQYPALRGLDVARRDDGGPLESHNIGHVFVLVPPTALEEQANGNRHLLQSRTYRHHRVILPSLGDSQSDIHPLASWWLLLFALSMLARYNPSDWTRLLDLSSSKIAAMIEYTLDAALAAVPELIAESLLALGGVSGLA
ncbi:YaaC family protein [Leifsonia sp. NPDC077715]|uniref:YaaC family protein n=1 Tax=Leifsonia sp. NPDC077715 TaxID=3155539 RepID=UPI00341F06A2